MKNDKILLCMAVLSACLLIGIACGQDYLDGGYVGRSGGSDIAQYFTDPIFSPGPIGVQRQSWEQMYYPYFGAQFFRDYAQPYQFRPGIYPGPYGVYPFNPEPYYSDFRLSSLAGMKWEPFQKNWTETLNYASASSSIKVYQNGLWVTP
jgi:hypothetical protein